MVSRSAARDPFSPGQLAALSAWGVIAVAAILWPFAAGGEFIWRDMVVIDHPGLHASNFGGGDLPARNAPQDGLLALFGILAPAPILVRVMLLSSAAAAVAGTIWLAHHTPRPGLVGTAAAIAFAVGNPFVIERFLQGQWSLVTAAWLLPLIAAAGLSGRRMWTWLAMFGASLTPTGALLGALVAVVCVRGQRLVTAGIGLLYCLPWALPGVIETFRGVATMNAPAAAAAFAPRAEAYAGTLGSMLGLGGIWNAEAVPESRTVGFALFGIAVAALVALGCAALNRATLVPLGALAAVGFAVACAAWLAPGAMAWALENIPGAGLVRDSHKLLMLAIPLYLAGLSSVRGNRAVAAMLCVFLSAPDAPTALSPLTATSSGVNYRLVAEIDGRDALFVDRGSLVTVDGRVAVDPYTKATPVVESGALAVDGAVVDEPSPRWVAAMEARRAGDMGRLEELGVGVVVEGGVIVAETNAPARRAPWALTVLWLFSPLAALAVSLLLDERAPRRPRPRVGARVRGRKKGRKRR